MTITGGSLTGGAGGSGTTDNVTNTHIPVKLSGAFEDSPLHWSGVPGENIISNETIEVPPGTIQVGEGLKMSAAGVIPIFRSLLTGIKYIPPLFIYDPSGSSGKPFKLFIDTPAALVVQSDFSTPTTLTGTFTNTVTASEFITALGIKTGIMVTSVTDSAGVARFNFIPGPTLSISDSVTIAGFTTNTSYNTTGLITASGTGYFEISSVSFGSDETGGSFNGPTPLILTGVRLEFISQTTGEPIYYFPSKAAWNENEGEDLIADGSGNVTIDINEAPIGLLIGEVVDVNYKIDSGVLLGTGTIPYQEVVRQVATFIDMVDVEDSVTIFTDFATTLSGKANVTPYTPTGDYNPATVKFVQDLISACAGFKGVYADLAALQAAHPTSTAGSMATVTSPNGNLFYWNTVSVAWEDTGTGYIGDMLKLIFDPTGVNGDAFSMGNMNETGTEKVFTSSERTDLGILTGAGDTTLHYHAADRARANHTGTQIAATISNFDTEVSNNITVAANTAKVSFPEAPLDSKQYSRKNGSWDEIVYPLNATSYTEISADTALDDYRNYIVDTKTPDDTVTINIPYGQLTAFTVRDMEKYFDKEECIITIRDSLNAIVHTATLDKKDKGWIFYNEGGTENDWKYGEIGKGKIEDIASDHIASIDFGNLIVEDDDCTCATVNGGLMYDNISDMDDCDEALAHKKYVDDNAGTDVKTMNHTAAVNIDGLDVSSLSPLGTLFLTLTADRELKSLDGGTNGDIIHVVNLSEKKLKLKNNSGTDEKIRNPGTGSGLDIDLDDYGGCTLVFNATSGYWHVVGYAREWS